MNWVNGSLRPQLGSRSVLSFDCCVSFHKNERSNQILHSSVIILQQGAIVLLHSFINNFKHYKTKTQQEMNVVQSGAGEYLGSYTILIVKLSYSKEMC